jgi:hypothetical protein
LAPNQVPHPLRLWIYNPVSTYLDGLLRLCQPFRWEQFHKAQLARKALLLDVWSWYFLLTSFVLSIALINPRLSVAMCVSAGILMWWYYFFPGPRARGRLGLAGEHDGTKVLKVSEPADAVALYFFITD